MVFYEFLIQSEATTSVNIKVSFLISLIFCSFLMPFFSSGLAQLGRWLLCASPRLQSVMKQKNDEFIQSKNEWKKIWISASLISMALELFWLCSANLDDRAWKMLVVRRFSWRLKSPRRKMPRIEQTNTFWEFPLKPSRKSDYRQAEHSSTSWIRFRVTQ